MRRKSYPDSMARVCLLACLLLSACATASLAVVDPVDHPETRVRLSLSGSSTSGMSPGQAEEFRALLTTELRGSGVRVVSSAEADLVEGTITKFSPGNRFLRYMLPPLGRGSFESTWHVRNASGEKIGECEIRGSITLGVFGGDFDEVLELVGEELARCLRGDG